MIDTSHYSKAKQWCGPSAVAMLANIPLREATEMLTRIHGGTYDELEGVWPEDVVIALNELGFKSTPVDLISRFPELTHGPTLRRYMNTRPAPEVFNRTLIEVDGHLLTSHWMLCGDNWTNGNMVPLHKFPKPNRLVKRAFIITGE